VLEAGGQCYDYILGDFDQFMMRMLAIFLKTDVEFFANICNITTLNLLHTTRYVNWCLKTIFLETHYYSRYIGT
jgi:hypothetical protein